MLCSGPIYLTTATSKDAMGMQVHLRTSPLLLCLEAGAWAAALVVAWAAALEVAWAAASEAALEVAWEAALEVALEVALEEALEVALGVGWLLRQQDPHLRQK